jgi:hypothetical protein
MTTHVTTINTSRSQRVAGRLGRFLVALALTVGALAAVAAPAQAECWLSEDNFVLTCHECRHGTGYWYPLTQYVQYFTCLTLDHHSSGIIDVHIGIEVFMSQQDAQAIINYSPGEEFSAKIFGDDQWYDNALINVPVTQSGVFAGGLFADFDYVATFEQLNEDSGYGDNFDELYGRISLYDGRWNRIRSFHTSTIGGYY